MWPTVHQDSTRDSTHGSGRRQQGLRQLIPSACSWHLRCGRVNAASDAQIAWCPVCSHPAGKQLCHSCPAVHCTFQELNVVMSDLLAAPGLSVMGLCKSANPELMPFTLTWTLSCRALSKSGTSLLRNISRLQTVMEELIPTGHVCLLWNQPAGRRTDTKWLVLTPMGSAACTKVRIASCCLALSAPRQ